MRRSLLAALVLVAALSVQTGAQITYTLLDVGAWSSAGTRDGQGAEALFNSPSGIARDSAGNFYVADTSGFTVRKITPTGLVSTLAGNHQSGTTDGTGAGAFFVGPRGIAVDASNNVYVTDPQNMSYAVRKITPAGVVTTLGTAAIPNGSNAWLAIAVSDIDGAVFVANTGNHIIERFTQAGAYSVFAGQSGTTGEEDGTGSAARFTSPGGIAVDAAGLVYVADTLNHTIRRITPEGVVSTWLGVADDPGPNSANGFPIVEQYQGVDGPAATARFYRPESLTLDRATGRLLVVTNTYVRSVPGPIGSNYRNRLRAIAVDGTVSTILGDTTGTFQFRSGVWSGSVAMITAQGMIFSVTTSGVLTEFAGRGSGCTSLYPVDGTRYSARFCAISSIDVSPAGIMYVADRINATIRQVMPDGTVTTISGSARQYGSTDGAAADARFGNNTSYPNGVGIGWGPYGTFIADTVNSTIRAIKDGVTYTVAGAAGEVGSADGQARTTARFNLPHDVVVDSQDRILVTDTANSTIRRITNPFAVNTFQATVSTVAGVPGSFGSADGTGAAARFSGPHGIAIGPGDIAYIADTGNHTIRRMTPDGVVTTLAGAPGQVGSADGNGANARFNQPWTIAVDRDGNVFVGELSGLRRITPTGDVSTISLTTPGTVEDVDAAGTLYLRYGTFIRVATTAGTTAAAPAITAQPANLTVPAGSTTPGSMSVSASGVPTPTYRWQTSANGGETWSGVIDGAGISGSQTAALTFTGIAVSQSGRLYRAVATNSFGSVTSGSAVLTVMSTTPASLAFGIQRSSPHRVTPAQQITPRNASGASAWTASTDAAWLVADGSSTNGAQTGAFMISVNAAAINFSTAPATQTATVTLVATNIGVSITVPVTLRVHDPGPLPVLGQVDTPLQNATRVQGAIGVTGWAVHPLGISQIQVYRNCLVGFETCSGLGSGRSVVFLGTATFVPGARPDIEGAFPGYPAAHIGGWGMQILSNQLPRTTGTFAPSGGQGPITLYVLAIPVQANNEFNSTILSRSWTDPACPATGVACAGIETTITLDNDAIAKPFGTLDTPASGATVSGMVANFGWALTPDSDTTAGPGDILIPTNGSSMVVFIDGIATATVAYNQCRGTVGNPVPSGAFCNDDVASLFGNATPQPALGTRTSNPTRYRNLDAARGAIGAYNIDTTLLSNGLHTLAWSVTDSNGRVEGIGSRYFTVSNGSADAALGAAASAARLSEAGSLDPAFVAGAKAPATIGPTVQGRTGFDLRRPWTTLYADPDGIRHVRLPVTNGRVELSLGSGIEAGYLEANGAKRALPAGSAFDPSTGVFTWAPGPGFLGTYRLVFSGPEVQGSRGSGVLVDVTLNTPTPTPAGESEIRMFLDSAAAQCRVPGAECSVRVEGWSLDPQAEIGSGIGTVHVWATRVPGPGSWVPGAAAPVFLGEAALDVARPDVAAAFGAPFGHAGFRLETTAALPPGEYDITAYAWNWRTARWEDARTARATVR